MGTLTTKGERKNGRFRDQRPHRHRRAAKSGVIISNK